VFSDEWPKLGWHGNGLQKEWSFRIVLPELGVSVLACFTSLEECNGWLQEFEDAKSSLRTLFKNKSAVDLLEDDFEIVGTDSH